MNTQQAYINGFVKRANEYGLTSDQAIELLKQANSNDLQAFMQQMGKGLGDAGNALRGSIQDGADAATGSKEEIMKALRDAAANAGSALAKPSSDIRNALRDAGHGFASGVFRSQHPITNDIPLLGNAADFFINHDIDPMHAALGIGGAGVLGGGYLAHKLLGKKKNPEQQ